MIIKLTKKQLQDVNKRMEVISFSLANIEKFTYYNEEDLQREQDVLIEIQKNGYIQLLTK